jgi:hypothetical protein
MGCCISKNSLEKQAVYTPLPYKPYALSNITEVSQETEIEQPPPIYI